MDRVVEKMNDNKLEQSDEKRLFPILLVLSRLYPSMNIGPSCLETYVRMVVPCYNSAIYKTRMMAARCIASIVPTIQTVGAARVTNVAECYAYLLELLEPEWHSNKIHGALVQVSCRM